jgi:uncharacterized RDD family membrane protein YckC
MQNNKNTTNTFKKVSLLRILGAISYDLMLVFSLVFVLVLIFTLMGIDKKWVFWSITLPASYFYFVYSWVKTGQTLGMKSWDISIKNANYFNASVRFFASIFSWIIFGLGYIYILFNANNSSLHDKISQTFLVYKPKK